MKIRTARTKATAVKNRYSIESLACEHSADRLPADSFLALAGDLTGCLEGPEDLSTNEDYLDGYGQLRPGGREG